MGRAPRRGLRGAGGVEMGANKQREHQNSAGFRRN